MSGMPPSPISTNDRAKCLLDAMDFLKEKIEEAQHQRQSRNGAITEAAGIIPFLRSRLRQDEVLQTQTMLILDAPVTSDNWQTWWNDLLKPENDFQSATNELLSGLNVLKECISQSL